MISKSQMIPIILERCPAFAPAWEKYRESWGDEEMGIYIDIAEFARFVVDSYERQDTKLIATAFTVIEEFLVGGDEEVQAAASIGFLEDVRNIASWRSFGSAPFLQWLGPQSKTAWAEIEEVWRGKHSLMDVVRAERVARKKDGKN
jgi:hypothetical protein